MKYMIMMFGSFASYLRAAAMTASLPEQRYLMLRAARLYHGRGNLAGESCRSC